jgi:GNAT superfamily N-acetyltransferase
MENVDLEILLSAGRTITLRPVSAEDEEFLLSVYASTRAQELAQVPWSDEQKSTFVRWQFDLQRKDYDANYPNATYDVIWVDERPAGRIWISRDDEQIHLLDIALLDEFQNRGVGTVLLRRLINEAVTNNKRLRHMVFSLNTDARRFYERLGFVVFDEVGAYLQMEWRREGVTVNVDE